MKKIYAGVDVGSLSTEAVILHGDEVLGYSIVATGANTQKAAQESIDKAIKEAGIDRGSICLLVATGYGRNRVPFADKNITEITCHAKGAHFLFPKTRSVIDIGGQDSKAITMDSSGRITDFVMNDKCAAGTGRFLEVMAGALETRLEDMGKQALKAKKVVAISSMCTVFAESEVVSLIADGYRKEDIIRAITEAISQRVFQMAKRLRIEEQITLSGGVAKNRGVVEALKSCLKKKVNVPAEPQIIGALGAALYARNVDKDS
jgi:predicted CoA-substrate-specific enzyme activase